jgi:hypothetical protein
MPMEVNSIPHFSRTTSAYSSRFLATSEAELEIDEIVGSA